jgi:hypothetical protein
LVLVPLYYVLGGKGLNPGTAGQGACSVIEQSYLAWAPADEISTGREIAAEL